MENANRYLSLAVLMLAAGLSAAAQNLTGIAFPGAPYLIRAGEDEAATFELLVTIPETRGTLLVSSSQGIGLPEQRFSVDVASAGDTMSVAVSAKFQKNILPGEYWLTAAVDGTSNVAHALVRVVRLTLPETVQVGVVQGDSTALDGVLGRMGVPHVALTAEHLSGKGLDKFSTIVLDVDACTIRNDLGAAADVLLEYVKQGGTLLVLDQPPDAWTAALAPYLLELETRPVSRGATPTPLVPDHALFATPNPMEALDWAEWRATRDVVAVAASDAAYTTLLVWSGGTAPCCLIAPYGQGTYVYAGLDWPAQWPELRPGALSLLANLLAL